MNKLQNVLATIIFTLVLPTGVLWLTFAIAGIKNEPLTVEMKLKVDEISSVDHSQFEVLNQEFIDPRELTATCLSCHKKRDEEIMATAHWRCERDTEIPERGQVSIGKKNLINNFCTGVIDNNGSCMRCHIGYGWEDETFDFGDPKNIDCLVCHDNTGTYFKQKGRYGWPATKETANDVPLPTLTKNNNHLFMN